MIDEKPKRIDPYPRSDERSFAYQVARTTLDAAASAVPGAGYALGELVKHYIGEPLEKRREEWFARIGEGVIELQSRFEAFDPASLDQNEEFISVVYEATQIAMKTSHEEKREALRNTILNTALGFVLDDVVRGSFMDYVDRFSPLHIKALRLLQDPTKSHEMSRRVSNMMAGGLGALLEAAIPAEARGAPVQRVYSDLSSASLVEGGGLNVMMSDTGLMQKRTTAIGDDFLRFIGTPAA